VISGTEVVGLEQEFELLSGEKMTERAEEEEASVFDRFFFLVVVVVAAARLLPWLNLLSQLFVRLLRMSSCKLFVRRVWMEDC